MSVLTLLGWIVVHSMWQCTFIAGLAALSLGLLRGARPEARDRVATLALTAMALAPLLTAALQPDFLPEGARRPVMMTIDLAIPMPTYLEWRSVAIPATGALWLAGVVVGLVRMAMAWRRAAALRSVATSAADPIVRAEVAALSARLVVSTEVDVRHSALATVPMVLGWRRPVILLPDRAVGALSFDQLRSILAHELAHVRRRDYVANLWQLVADSLTFFHPAARWISRRIRIEREYCCDDAAMAIAGDRAVYAHALASLDDARSDCAIAVAARSGTLLDRIERIAGRPRRLMTAGRGVALMVLATIAAATLLASMLALPADTPAGTRLRSQRPPAGSVMPPPAGGTSQMKRRLR